MLDAKVQMQKCTNVFTAFITVCNWYRSGDKKIVRREIQTLLIGSMTCKQIKWFEIEFRIMNKVNF